MALMFVARDDPVAAPVVPARAPIAARAPQPHRQRRDTGASGSGLSFFVMTLPPCERRRNRSEEPGPVKLGRIL